MTIEESSALRQEIVERATQMASSGQYARCIDIEAAMLPQFGYQAMRADFRSQAFQDRIERICRDTFAGERVHFP